MWWLIAVAVVNDPFVFGNDNNVRAYSVRFATMAECQVAKNWVYVRRPEIKTRCFFVRPDVFPAGN